MEINTGIAERMARLRRRRKISQRELAARSGVSLGSLKRFEQSGEISLQSFTKLAIALEVEEELTVLFSEVPFASIEEVINGQTGHRRFFGDGSAHISSGDDDR